MIKLRLGSCERKWASVEEAAGFLHETWPNALVDDEGTIFRSDRRTRKVGHVIDGCPLELADALEMCRANELYEEVC